MKLFLIPVFLSLALGCSFLLEDQNEPSHKETHDFTKCGSSCTYFFDPGEHTYKYSHEAYERGSSNPRQNKIMVMRFSRFERREGVEFEVEVRDSGAVYDGVAVSVHDTTYRIKYKIISGIYYSDHASEVSLDLRNKCDSGGYCYRSLFFDTSYSDPAGMKRTVYRGDTLFLSGLSWIAYLQRYGLIKFVGMSGSSSSSYLNLIEKDGIPFDPEQMVMID